ELERTARDPAGPGEVATTVESALGEPGCTGVRADATIQGFGDAETGTAYGQGNCSRTFVVDIESYAPADAGGTLAAYAGPNPADAETCTSTRLEVFVWRRNRQTGAYEALTTRDGRAS